jgi:hypothetical protein
MEFSLNGRLEKKMIASCRNGDRSAYTGLVKAYSGRVFGICLGMLGVFRACLWDLSGDARQ